AEVDVDHARVRALLDHAGDDVALLAAELTEHGVVGEVAQTLTDDLLGREGCDATEVVRGGVLLPDHGALVVLDRLQHGDVAGLAVEFDAHPCSRFAFSGDVLEVGGEDGLFDDGDEFIEGDRLLLLDPAQHPQLDVHIGLPIQLSPPHPARPVSVQRYPIRPRSRSSASPSRADDGRRAATCDPPTGNPPSTCGEQRVRRSVRVRRRTPPTGRSTPYPKEVRCTPQLTAPRMRRARAVDSSRAAPPAPSPSACPSGCCRRSAPPPRHPSPPPPRSRSSPPASR